MAWKVEYQNDVNDDDTYCFEWWEVSNVIIVFKVDKEIHAKWLCRLLNILPESK